MPTFTRSAGLSIVLALAVGAVAIAIAQSEAPRRTQWDGVFTDAQADRGRVIYAQHCARCHGTDLRGIPREVRFPGEAPRTPALVGDEFLGNWVGLTAGDLFERTRISMPQDNPGSLNRQQNADLLAFILQFAGYPSGANELPQLVSDLATVDLVKLPR